MYEEEADEDATKNTTTEPIKNNEHNTLWLQHREEEYKMLSQQHLKKLQLGIPVSVLGFVIITSQYLLAHPLIVNDSILESSYEKETIQLLLLILVPITLMGILCLNTVFAVHRISDDARIVAYIQLFFEDPKYRNCWIGWETSLKIYRSNRKRKIGEFQIYGFRILISEFAKIIRNSILDLPSSLTRSLNFFYSSIGHPIGYDTYLYPELFIGNLMSTLIIFTIYFFIIMSDAKQYVHQYNLFLDFYANFLVSFILIFFSLTFLLAFHISVNTILSRTFLDAIDKERKMWIKACKDTAWKECIELSKKH